MMRDDDDGGKYYAIFCVCCPTRITSMKAIDRGYFLGDFLFSRVYTLSNNKL
jgi:hypothetical protein